MKLPVLLIPYHTLSWLGGRRPVSGCVSVTAQYGVRTRVEKGKGTDTGTTGKFRRPGPTLAPALGAGGNLNWRRWGRVVVSWPQRGERGRGVLAVIWSLGRRWTGKWVFGVSLFLFRGSEEVLTEEGRR